MGHVAVHIEAAGLHDNGREDDIDEMVKRFAAGLADAGHQVHSVTVTAGATKELLNRDETTPLRAGPVTGGPAHLWRTRSH